MNRIRGTTAWVGTLLLVLCLLTGHGAWAQATGDYRSANGGVNWNVNTTWQKFNGTAWVAAGAGDFPGAVAGTYAVTIQTGHQVRMPGTLTLNSIGSLTIQGTGSIQWRANANNVINISGNLSFNQTGTAMAYNGNGAGTINIGGNVTFSSGTLSGAMTGTNYVNFVFNSTTADQTITVSAGTPTFRNLTVNKSGRNLTVTGGNIVIDNQLSLQSDGYLIIAASANVFMSANAAAISAGAGAFSATRMIVPDVTTSAGGTLSRIGTTAAGVAYTFPVGTTVGYNAYSPVTVGTVTGGSAAACTLSVKQTLETVYTGKIARYYRITTSNITAGTAPLTFNYVSNDVYSGDNASTYNTIWSRTTSGGTWTSLTGTTGTNTFSVTSASLVSDTDIYTVGTPVAYPITYYSYTSGNWTDPDTWTVDPSGSTLINSPTNGPANGDKAVILNGQTVTMNVSNVSIANLQLEKDGILDLGTTTGHTFGNVEGQGTLRTNSGNLPTATYTSFAAATGGKVVFYNFTGNLPTNQTVFNNVELAKEDGSATSYTYTLVSDWTINGSLTIIRRNGGAGTVTWQINDASTVRRIIKVTGDLALEQGGLITVGTGVPAGSTQANGGHQLVLNGNFYNRGGVARFFNTTVGDGPTLTTANYYSGTYANTPFQRAWYGATVDVKFTGANNATLFCAGTTDFYRLRVRKGTDQTYTLRVLSTDTTNFRLYAPNTQGPGGYNPPADTTKALYLESGTFRLGNNISLQSLTEGGQALQIGVPVQLWVDSARVVVTKFAGPNNNRASTATYLVGTLKITSGLFSTGASGGILYGPSAGPAIQLSGGQLDISQLGGSGVGLFAFVTITGGTMNILGSGVTPGAWPGYPLFDMASATNSLTMTGGTINFVGGIPAGGTTAGIDIQAKAGNYNVTGGTINISYPDGTPAFTINSASPLPPINVTNTSGTGNVTVQARAVGGQTDVRSIGTVTLNGFTTWDGNTNTVGLTVGGDLVVTANATYNVPGAPTTFNGTGAQSFNNVPNLTLGSLVVSKASGTLTLNGAGTVTTGGLTITSGTLNDNGKTVTVTGNIVNSGTHTGAGKILMQTAAAVQTIGGSGSGVFQNLELNNTNAATAPISLLANQRVNGTLTLTANKILDLASYNLTLGSAAAISSPGYSATRHIQTAGQSSNGGLTRTFTAASGDVLFPVGSAGKYTPTTLNATTTGTYGTVTVRPVNSAHPNLTTTGQSLAYYWRVTSAGWTGTLSATHKSYTYLTANLQGTLTNYRVARYDAASSTWTTSTGTYTATGTSVVNPNPPNNSSFRTGANWNTLTQDFIDGDYTVGSAGFTSPTVFTSNGTGGGNFNVGTTWAGGAAPSGTGYVVRIVGNDVVTLTANATMGALDVATNATFSAVTFTGGSWGTVTGTGTIRLQTATFPTGDFSAFLGTNGGTIEYRSATALTLPAAPTSYWNLAVRNTATAGTQQMTLPNVDLTVLNNLNLYSQTNNANRTVQFNTGGTSRTLTVGGNLTIEDGRVLFNNTTAQTVNVAGNVTVSAGAVTGQFQSISGTHNLSVGGNLNVAGTFSGGAGNISLTMNGSSNASITGAGAITLTNLTVNKGTSKTTLLTFDASGTVTLPADNWLTLANGTLVWNRNNTLPITTTSTFNIPTTGRLRVLQGTVNLAQSAADNNDVTLAGELEIQNGTVNIGVAGNNNNNDLEYTSDGNSQLTISGGALNVNGQIRRSTTITSGSLVYTQSNGTVAVRGRNPQNTRGIFELYSNTGTSFNMSGGTLIVERAGGGSIGDLYLLPETGNVTGGTIQLGIATAGAQTILVESTTPLFNLTVSGAAANAVTARVQVHPLTIKGTLTTSAGTANSIFDSGTNSLTTTILGDVINNGQFKADGTALTVFSGTTAQAFTNNTGSTATLYNLEINKATGTLTFNGTLAGGITINNNLTITQGTVTSGGAITFIDVNGNISNSGTYNGSLALRYAGTASTHTLDGTNGTISNLTIGGTVATKVVTMTGTQTLTGTLDLSAGTTRLLDVGGNLLTFGPAASATAGSVSRMVITNGALSDAGVAKVFNSGANVTFIYPVGVAGKYTPVTYTTPNLATSGTITVRPINSKHPLTLGGGTSYQLAYYWNVTSTGNILSSLSHTYTPASSDMTGTTGTLVAARLSGSPSAWTTGEAGSSATTSLISFGNVTSAPGNGTNTNSVDYTAGDAARFPNPITPLYSFNGAANITNMAVGANWNDANTWTTDPTGATSVNAQIPQGLPVVILPNHRVNTNGSGRRANSVTLSNGATPGTLFIGTNIGHIFGTILGGGRLQTRTTTFPAANYTSFVAAGGGIIEYVLPIANLSSRTTYCTLAFSGAGTISLPSFALTMNGGFTIGSGVTVNNTNNINLSVAGDWSNSGTYTAGTGTVTLNGTASQSVSGSNTFYNLVFNKPAGGITLAGTGSTTVTNQLTMTSGIVTSSATHRLILNSTATLSGGSATSFVVGPMTHTVASASPVVKFFPVGNDITSYRPLTLSLTQTNATSRTYTTEVRTGKPTTRTLPVTLDRVSAVRYYNITQTPNDGIATGAVSFSYDADDGVNDPTNLRVAKSNGGSWIDLGGVGSGMTGSISSTNNFTAFSDFILGNAIGGTNPLPVTYLSIVAELTGTGTVSVRWTTANELNNSHFIVQRSLSPDFTDVTVLGTVAGHGTTNFVQNYTWLDTDVPSAPYVYYRLVQVDFDGTMHHTSPLEVAINGKANQNGRFTVFPNPISDSFWSLAATDAAFNLNTRVTLTLVGADGKVYFTQTGPFQVAVMPLYDAVAPLPAGVYTIRIAADGQVDFLRIVKL